MAKYAVNTREGHPWPNSVDAYGLRGPCSVAEVARSYGPGTHPVIRVERRFGRDDCAWPWGEAVVLADGAVELIRYEG
jgi:hypothetical protein